MNVSFIPLAFKWCPGVTDYQYYSETASALPLYVSDMVKMSHGLQSLGVYFHLFIPLNFHRFTIKSLGQFHHTAKLTPGENDC